MSPFLPRLWQFADAVLLFAQNAAPEVAEPLNEAPANPGDGGGSFWFMPAAMMTMLLVYLLFMRPDQKRRKEQEEARTKVKKNDHVITVGGICGVVVNVTDHFLTIRIDDSTNTRIKVLRSAISHVGDLTEGAAGESDSEKNA